MKSYLKALAIVPVIISLAACTPNKTEKFRECYRDEMFIAMLNDSMYKYKEEVYQIKDSGAFYASFEQPLLWNDNGDTTLRKMVDYYNFYGFVNAIQTDIDTWVRFDCEGTDYEVEMLDLWQQITLSGLSNKSMRRRLKETLNDCLSKEIDVSNIDEELSTWKPDVDSAQFEDILNTIRPQCFLPAYFRNNYCNYVGEDVIPDSIMKADLYLTYQSEQNYDMRCAMLFLLIGVNCLSYSNESLDTLINDAEEILTSGQYTPLLPLLWRAYRVAYCEAYCCPSTYCDIPNVRFNYYRRLVAYTYLRHIEKNPDDITAKIQFSALASYENINRFGSYPYGHQSAEEYCRLYWKYSVL